MMCVPYMMLHFGEPLAETMSSVFGGAILGLLSLRTNSIFGGVLVHMGIVATCDFVVISRIQYWTRFK